MDKPIDCDNEQLFKYIHSIIRGKGEPHRLTDGSIRFPSMINADPQLAIETFEIRYNNNEIATRYKYEQFISDKDLQPVIRGLKLDADAFWLLVIFCFDYALDRCGGLKIGDNSKDLIEKFIHVAESVEETDSDKIQLTLKSDKSKITLTDGMALSTILKWVKQGYDLTEDKDSLSAFDKSDPQQMFLQNEESDSVLIWYFATLMRYFFELNPQYKGDSKKCDGLSLSKNLLISTLIFNLGLSRNPSFRESDETLKGFFKQYKNKKIDTLGNLYY